MTEGDGDERSKNSTFFSVVAPKKKLSMAERAKSAMSSSASAMSAAASSASKVSAAAAGSASKSLSASSKSVFTSLSAARRKRAAEAEVRLDVFGAAAVAAARAKCRLLCREAGTRRALRRQLVKAVDARRGKESRANGLLRELLSELRELDGIGSPEPCTPFSPKRLRSSNLRMATLSGPGGWGGRGCCIAAGAAAAGQQPCWSCSKALAGGFLRPKRWLRCSTMLLQYVIVRAVQCARDASAFLVKSSVVG